MNSKIDFINGKTGKSLIKMFMPLFAAMTLTMIYSMVDSLWVGNLLGEHGMSALTAGTAIILVLNSLAMGMGNGISVMVAKLVGAGKKDEIPGATATIITVSTAVSFIIFILCELLAAPLLKLMGTPQEVYKDATTYLMIYLVGNVALFLYMQFTSIFRAFGDPTFQMKGMLMTTVLNAILDPFFIRMMGLSGAAIVTVASEVLCLVYAIIYYKKHKLFSMDFKKVNMKDVGTMLKLSVPTTIQSIMPPLSSAIMISFITEFGIDAMAGFGVARNLELIMFMPTTGMCMAITAIVGQCAGAKRQDRAEDYLKAALLVGGGLIAVLSIVVVAFSGQLTTLFGQGAGATAIVAQFFRIISIGYVLYMLTSCMQGYLTGLGQPSKAMVLLILYYIVIRIPAAIIFKGAFGLEGIWLAFLVSHILAFIVATVMVLLSRKTHETIRGPLYEGL
ncbi:MATE family efflux transporter [Butyrivibrio sp. CB08]|uniref:MATE family efflux transporter n=1 Tax=Butyrivibrio sp. CB08 TaxID=2364879 RepID=UPI000EA86076|nr:MATE family efflux transporter [Butyrivibrio sp. CB08]RKM62051.1 MATE family efflux transporter [Butyrivibrio sp. CB08]